MAVVYRKGSSFLHSLDARTKLVMFFAVTFISLLFLDPLIIGSLFFGLYALAAKAVGREVVAQSTRPLVVIFTVFALYSLYWLRPEEATHLFYFLPWWSFFPVTLESLISSVALFFRFFIVVLAIHTVLYTTPAADLVLGLTKRESSRRFRDIVIFVGIVTALLFLTINLAWAERLQNIFSNVAVALAISLGASLGVAVGAYWLLSRGLPTEIGITISLGFSTVGILTEQTQKIMDAQKARGYEMEQKNALLRMKAFASSLIPIFFATIDRAENIAIAILARAFDLDIRNRTYHRALTFQKNDYVMLTILLCLLFAGLGVNYMGWGKITEIIVRALFFS